ncbi:MAG: choice-of-anchor D domain-containing protein [Deltaproteobacteria bacterium]|nr:choice-of-anchor D domain-containing protein [Deltaproteobacteria bacterium]
MRVRLVRVAGVAVLLAAAFGACGDGGSFTSGALPVLEVRVDGQTVEAGGAAVVQLGAPGQGEAVVGWLELVDTGNAALRVESIEWTSTPPGALRLELPSLPQQLSPVGAAAEPSSALRVPILARDLEAGQPLPAVEIAIGTERTVNGSRATRIRLQTARSAGELSVTPSVVDFGVQAPGTRAVREVALLATGGAPVQVDALVLSGAAGFAVEVGDAPLGAGEGGAGGRLVLDPPWLITPGRVERLTVTYEAQSAAAATGTLTVETAEGAPRVVALRANTAAPCAVAEPARLDFGTRAVGQLSAMTVTLRSCGTGPVTVSSLALDAATDEGFSLVDPPALPAVLAPNERLELTVRYLPTEQSPIDDAGAALPDVGLLRALTDAPVPAVEVPLSGVGALEVPPTAVIVIAEGEEVTPQTVLHLSGTQSYGPAPIAAWHWQVDPPEGVAPAFSPHDGSPEPTFEANVAGTYRFTLTVEDIDGVPSAEAAVAVVQVIPDEAIHVELLWETPGDPDPTDEGPEAGADLDLHFVHPYAPGDGWFDVPFDCYWFNPHPNWAALAPQVDDDPGLDRDDTDGAGPENLNLSIPEAGLAYRVGVQSWADHGFGASVATVRVFIYGELTYEASCPIGGQDLWDAARILWPSGEVVPTGGVGACVTTPDAIPDGLFPTP